MIAIRHLLQTKRLLTLTGPGGTGKTRLALAIAASAASEFVDGVTFVDLAPLSDGSLVVQAIAHALGILENSKEPPLETLKRALSGQKHLLLIDNFEHVIEGAPIVPQLLSSAPRVKILVTSRETLRVSGEQEYAVPPLTLPVIEGSSVEDIQQSESVMLFQQRAAMIRPDFKLTEENLPVVAEICIRLDGLPLAIELAAARCKLLSPQAMLARLDNRLNALRGGSRDAPTRQQTLRSTIEWSYNLLNDGEKRLFARLAVFRGGLSLEAVEVVCSEGLPTDVLDTLASLVDKNMVQQKEDAIGDPRFFMLETLHEFAWERLIESGEAEIMRRHHAEYFGVLAERAEPELHFSHQKRWYQLLETERDNMRLALEWSLQRNITLGLRLVGALWWNWFNSGYHAEGYQWTQQLLRHIDEAPIRYHPKFLVAAGRMVLLQSDFISGKHLLRRAITISRQLGDKRQAAWALILDSITLLDEPDQAKSAIEEGLSLFRELDDKAGIPFALNALGEIARMNGQNDLAKRNYEAAISIAEQTGNARRKCVTRANLSYVAQHENNHKLAIELLREVIKIACEQNSYLDMAFGIQILSGSLAAVGETERATRLWAVAETIFRRIGAFIEPVDVPEYERINHQLRSLLDEATFQTAWAEGRKMTLEQATADALR